MGTGWAIGEEFSDIFGSIFHTHMLAASELRGPRIVLAPLQAVSAWWKIWGAFLSECEVKNRPAKEKCAHNG
jgi:hypothetical protein